MREVIHAIHSCRAEVSGGVIVRGDVRDKKEIDWRVSFVELVHISPI